MNMLERFEQKFDRDPSGCWNWIAAKHERGYGYFYTSSEYSPRKMDYAHRVALFLYKGIRDDTKVVIHKCDNPSCVNPDHLLLGSNEDNTKDMLLKGRVIAAKQRFTAEDQKLAISMRNSGVKVKDIAKHFGCSQGHASRLSRGLRKHFNEENR